MADRTDDRGRWRSNAGDLSAYSRRLDARDGGVVRSFQRISRMNTTRGWIEGSIMARRGVAGGKAGARHSLTEEAQGKFKYVYGPYDEPVLRIKPGDIVDVETRDAYDGRIKTEADLPSKVLVRPYSNPQNGQYMSRVRSRATSSRFIS